MPCLKAFTQPCHGKFHTDWNTAQPNCHVNTSLSGRSPLTSAQNPQGYRGLTFTPPSQLCCLKLALAFMWSYHFSVGALCALCTGANARCIFPVQIPTYHLDGLRREQFVANAACRRYKGTEHRLARERVRMRSRGTTCMTSWVI